MKLELIKFEDKMDKAITSYKYELEGIRVGRANPNVLSKIKIDYWGTPTGITEVSNVKASDARTLVITPWDTLLLREIEKATNMSDLGINPQNDGKCIRLSFPALTEDRRKELVKQVGKVAEGAKIQIRNVRRDANDLAKNMKKNSEMTEDEQKASEEEIQTLTDDYIAKVDAVTENKTKEIMEI